MSLGRSQALERLAAEEDCLGAVFLTYGFDPSFFEEHVLRAVLRLSSDPLEQPVRYHDEALRRLQVTPIAAFADAGERQAGRRLPYDLLDVHTPVFHPKLALLVYEEFARVHIGSGNLTFGGYGTNEELFVTLDLHYDEPQDVATLGSLLGSVERLTSLARTKGSQYALVRDEVGRRMPELSASAEAPVQWVDSTREPLLSQVLGLVPRGATVERIGLMAPFFERDDAAAAESMNSVFGQLREFAGPDAGLDIGVLWDNPPVQPEAHTVKLEDRLGSMWAWRSNDEETGEPFVEYLVPTKIGRKRLHYTDQWGDPDTWSLEGVKDAIEEQTLWPVCAPVIFAPAAALASAETSFGSMQLWLHPSTRLVDGRPLHRPLHAKLMTIQYAVDGAPETLVVIGSANASRRALLRSTDKGGNAELCLVMRIRKPLRLPDVAENLVAYARVHTQVQEREFPELSPNRGLAILDATYDASEKTLRVEWDPTTDLPAWALKYRGATIAEGAGVPSSPTVVTGFELHRESAELLLVVGADAFPIPILVRDLVALHVGPGEGLLGLHDLLVLLSRRIGHERATMLAEQRATPGAPDDALEEAFGSGFGPTDVFKAWWTVVEELAARETSVAGVRIRLDGALGLSAVWTRMLEAAESNGPYAPEVIWFFGAELRRELKSVAFADDAIGAKKRELVQTFLQNLDEDLGRLTSAGGTEPWMQRVRAFYGVSS
ncbi:MAG: hypothetical protein ACE37F_35475 [Nannocystaceae bacterium]|nr:hypothetical protein [bacterium]